MSLADLANELTAVAFDIAQSFEVSGSINYITGSIRDTNTQKNSIVYAFDTVDIVKYDFNLNEKLGEGINNSDQKLLIQRSQLTQDVEDYKTLDMGSEHWTLERILIKESSNSIVVWHARLKHD